MKNFILTTAAVAASAVIVPAASAASFLVDTTTNTPLAGATYTTFNGQTLGSTTQSTGTGITVSFAGTGGFVQGFQPFLYSAPTVSGGNGAAFGQANGTDTTTYVSSGVGSATMTLTTPGIVYFGLLWGSVDAYNSLTFNTADGMSTVFTGSQIGSLGQSRYVNFFSSSAILSVVASSTSPSFELDNIAMGAIPEPATWAMMLAGFGAVGFAMRRRRAAVRVSYTA